MMEFVLCYNTVLALDRVVGSQRLVWVYKRTGFFYASGAASSAGASAAGASSAAASAAAAS